MICGREDRQRGEWGWCVLVEGYCCNSLDRIAEQAKLSYDTSTTNGIIMEGTQEHTHTLEQE